MILNSGRPVVSRVRAIIVFALFLFLFTSAGCGKSAAPVSSELLDQVLNAGRSLSSYRMEGSMTMNGGERSNFSMTADFSGEYDVAGKNLSMKTDIKMAVPEASVDSSQISETYLFSDVMYEDERSTVSVMQWEIDGKQTGWMSAATPYADIPSAEWGDNNQLAQQLDLMSQAEIRNAGSEKIRGVDSYVFEISASGDKLVEALLKQPGIGYVLGGIDAAELAGIIDRLTIREWIAEDTDLLMRTETDIRLDMSGDEVDMRMTMEYYDHNLPLEITLPEDCPRWPPPAEEVWADWNQAQS